LAEGLAVFALAFASSCEQCQLV